MEQQSDIDVVYVHKLEVQGNPTSEDVARSAYEVLEAVGPPLKTRVVIKPNITIPAHRNSGIVTHPDFVAGMIDYFREMGVSAKNIMVAEGGGSNRSPHSMEEHFGQSGYTDMTRSRGVRLVNINQDENVPVHLPQAEILKDIGIAKTVKDDDTCFINVPKYKTHNLAVTTLSMKNLMGTIVPYAERHLCNVSGEYASRAQEITPYGITLREERLCRKLCDLALASKPHLNVVEGIVGRDGTAFRHGKNIQTNLVIAGENVASVDAVGSYLMGFEPAGICYLKIAAERGLGDIDVEKMKIYEIRDGQSVPCSHLARFMSEIPFEVLKSDKEVRDIPLNKDMQEHLRMADK